MMATTLAYDALLAATALLAGAVAAVTGFGIGSVITPVLGLAVGTKLAVAAAAIPHFVGTLQRFWILRRHVDRRVVLGFGLMSAVGGLAGALLHARASSRALGIVFGVLLLVAGISELTGWIARRRWGRKAAWVAGALSGLLGGLVGNQGGIRSASMLGFDVPKESFVATATAIGLFVDVARLPVYLVTEGRAIALLWRPLLLATIAVMIGTALGARLLRRIPQGAFRRVVAVLLLLLGIYMFVDALLPESRGRWPANQALASCATRARVPPSSKRCVAPGTISSRFSHRSSASARRFIARTDSSFPPTIRRVGARTSRR